MTGPVLEDLVCTVQRGLGALKQDEGATCRSYSRIYED
jgi:hypothetical protein